MSNQKCSIKLSSDIFAVLIKFLSLKEIFQKILCLDRETRQVVCSENYILIKKFLQLFCINRRLKNSDLFAFVDMIKCIKENVSIAQSNEQKQIIPFGYYSDCGSQEDRLYYWIQNIFEAVPHCYSMAHCSGEIPEPHQRGINIQAYLGRFARANTLF